MFVGIKPHRAGFLQERLPSWSALSPILIGLLYYAGAEAAFAIGTLTHMFAPFWPPNVILLCVFLSVPERRWWQYALAALPAHLAAEAGVAMPLPQMLIAFGCNLAVALLNGVALRRVLVGPPWLGSLRKASLYLLVAAIVAPGLAAFGGAAEPIVGGADPSDYWSFWWRWYLSNALGSLTLTPVFLTWFAEPRGWFFAAPLRRWIEAAALVLGLTLSCAIAFGVSADGTGAERFLPALLYAPIPLLLWAAVRFGGRGASGAILIVTVLALWHAMQGNAPFAATGPGDSVLALQLFLAVMSVPVILLAAIVEELHRTNARLASVLDGISDCHYTLGWDGRFTSINPKAAMWLGCRSPDAMIGQSCWALPTDTTPGIPFVRRTMAERIATHGEVALATSPQTWIDFHVYPWADGVSVFFRDITKRKAVEQELKLSANRLQLAHEAAGIGVWEWDFARKRLYWSPETYQLYGIDPAAQGLDLVEEWRRVLHPDDRDWVDRQVQGLLEARHSFAIQFRIRRGGETRFMLGRGKVFRDASGRPVQIIGANLDITERRRAEASLRESEERFRAMAETVPDILFTLSAAGGCDYLSPRFHEYTGLSQAATSGDGWSDALLRSDKGRLLAALQSAGRTGATFGEECRVRAGDGSYRWFVVRCRPIVDDMGRIQKWFGAMTEIDELKRGADALSSLTAQLLKVQDDERRRISRELHDSTAQNLLGATLNIELALQLTPAIGDPARKALQESSELIEQSQREIRTISYLFHPPILDYAGLPAALAWYVEGFSKRSGIAVRLDVSASLGERRPSSEAETALFRVVQEALTNVHRHSGSSTASIRLTREVAGPAEESSLAFLEIADGGRAAPREADAHVFAGEKPGGAAAPVIGVGIAGMRERVRQLGGRLDIRRSGRGMIVRAIVPLDGNGDGAPRT